VAPPPAKRLPELVEDGYDLLRQRQVTAACDQWLAAWQLAQTLLTPQMTRSDEFDAADPGHFHPFSDWTMELMFELHNAGLDNPAYVEKRLAYVRAFLARFPQEKADRYLEFRRAEGEALWALGRIVEAEAVYQALTQKLPDMAWGYIGWADRYYLFTGGEPKDYERAAAILQQAWDRPNLDDRESVAERLKMLYKAWGRPLPSWVKGGRW
jgi:tetratricopeptide (TPR) repeat protein